MKNLLKNAARRRRLDVSMRGAMETFSCQRQSIRCDKKKSAPQWQRAENK